MDTEKQQFESRVAGLLLRRGVEQTTFGRQAVSVRPTCVSYVLPLSRGAGDGRLGTLDVPAFLEDYDQAFSGAHG